jgi:hypothetical protein
MRPIILEEADGCQFFFKLYQIPTPQKQYYPKQLNDLIKSIEIVTFLSKFFVF